MKGLLDPQRGLDPQVENHFSSASNMAYRITNPSKSNTLGSHILGEHQSVGFCFPEMRRSSHQSPHRNQPLGLNHILLSSPYRRRVTPWDQNLSRTPSFVASLKNSTRLPAWSPTNCPPVMTPWLSSPHQSGRPFQG